jgi:serine protease Do
MKKSIKICAFAVLIGLSSFGQQTQPKKIEKVIDQVLSRAYNATVKITTYDSVSKTSAPGGYSGVVVSVDGYIMTAAHATKVGQAYKVVFPNGDEHIAKAIGRISMGRASVRKDSLSLDLSILKITKPGKWTFVDMAESVNMKVGELCVSISSPGSFSKKQPSVRLGRITDVNFSNGYFESTCKMEPGDSGGALFNSDGKLIGIHSWITNSEESNFEIPVDLFKKYWSALHVAKDYKSFPEADKLATVPPSSTITTIAPIQQLVKLPKKQAESAVAISSLIGNKKTTILGTLVSYEKLSKVNTYIVSKSSMVGNEAKVTLNAVEQPAKIMARDQANDLVLLEVALPSLSNSIKLKSSADTLAIQFADLGNFLVSALASNKQYVSVLSDRYIDIPRSKGELGPMHDLLIKK